MTQEELHALSLDLGEEEEELGRGMGHTGGLGGAHVEEEKEPEEEEEEEEEEEVPLSKRHKGKRPAKEVPKDGDEGRGRKRGKTQGKGQGGEGGDHAGEGGAAEKVNLSDRVELELESERGKYLEPFLKKVQEEADRLGLAWSPHADAKPVSWPDRGELDYKGMKEPRRTLISDEDWAKKEDFWPWCTLNSRDPWSRTAPMPRGWERFLCENTPPRLPLEIEYHSHKAGQSTFRRSKGSQKVPLVWKYCLDHFPSLLPPQISRPPFYADLPEGTPRPLPDLWAPYK